jgi:hypothetical protein
MTRNWAEVTLQDTVSVITGVLLPAGRIKRGELAGAA